MLSLSRLLNEAFVVAGKGDPVIVTVIGLPAMAVKLSINNVAGTRTESVVLFQGESKLLELGARVTLVERQDVKVRLAIEAPATVSVYRKEKWHAAGRPGVIGLPQPKYPTDQSAN